MAGYSTLDFKYHPMQYGEKYNTQIIERHKRYQNENPAVCVEVFESKAHRLVGSCWYPTIELARVAVLKSHGVDILNNPPGKLYVVIDSASEGYFLGVYDDKDLAIKNLKEFYKEVFPYDLDDPACEYHLVENKDDFTVQLRIPDVDEEIGEDYGDTTVILIVELNKSYAKFIGG